MDRPAIMEDLDDYPVDVLGQHPSLDIYTQISLCFSVVNASAQPAIIDTLTQGLERLSASFPWIAGQVVKEGSTEGNTGIYKIKPLTGVPRLLVENLTDDRAVPTMDALRQTKFPISTLDETITAPRSTFPGVFNTSGSDTKPVFLIQASFISGGLLLTFLGQHQIMDGTGQGQIIDLFSKACHNRSFTKDEVSSGNLDRRNLLPLLDDSYETGSGLDHQLIKPAPSQSARVTPPECIWANFVFDSDSLTALKVSATKSLSSGYISTDDALSAFIWQSVIRARVPRLDPTSKSTFARAVDTRRCLDIPATYPGLMQNMTYNTYTVQQLAEEPLGVIASQLRSTLNPPDLAYRTRALATAMDRSPDKTAFSFAATFEPSTSMQLSSWAKLDCYELDFNLGLGIPEAVRRPRFTPVEGLAYLMPKAPDGEIVLAICLRDEDMGRLRADEGFAGYAKYIG